MKLWLTTLCAALALTACGSSSDNDPIYLALKANPPTKIPAKHLPKLRRGIVSCDVYKEGTAGQYMTCWWPAGGSNFATLTYYGAGQGLRRPHPKNIIAPGGKYITGFIPIK